jgi:multicomponent Na+:H+ antiporter subunit G
MEVVSALLILAGSTFTLIAAIGLHRFDSVFARMHAAGKSTTFGLGLILVGAALRAAQTGSTAKLGVVGLLAVITIPAGVHLIARAAFRAGTELAPDTHIDQGSSDMLERRLPGEANVGRETTNDQPTS